MLWDTQEGIWSVLRSWIRPYRGISQEKLSVYLGLFEFLFNTRKRRKAAFAENYKKLGSKKQRLKTEITNQQKTCIAKHKSRTFRIEFHNGF